MLYPAFQWDLVAQLNATQVLSTKCFGTNEDKSFYKYCKGTPIWVAMDNDKELERPDALSPALRGFCESKGIAMKNLFTTFRYLK